MTLKRGPSPTPPAFAEALADIPPRPITEVPDLDYRQICISVVTSCDMLST